MKKLLPMLLALLLILQLAACGGSDGAGLPKPEIPEAPGGSEPTQPPFQDYVYEEAGFTIGVPWSLPPTPEQTDNGILFRDPEGAWTVEFEPLTVSETPHRVNNTAAEVRRFLDFGYYQDVKIEEGLAFGDFTAVRLSFSRNPDWVEASMGYTASSFTEPHCLILVDYTDVVVGNYGGLIIDVSGPKKTPGQIQPILDDPDVQTLLGNVRFAAPGTVLTASIPGISVDFPIRWDVGDDGERTLWGSWRGDEQVTLFLGSSIYKDPQEGAAAIAEDYKTMVGGGRTWYGDVTRVTVGGSDYCDLVLLTEFTEYHALRLELRMYNAEEEDVLAFIQGDPFRGILESIRLDPDNYHDPEKDMMDASGFECNNVNEISAYTGTATELTIPAVVGKNEIVGIRSGVFKDNTDITRVTLAPGIQYVGYGSFENCTALETVVLPSTVTYIDSKAFSGCTALREIQFGDCLTVIDSEAFLGCSALQNVSLPESLREIGSSAFRSAGDGSGIFRCPAEGVVFGRSSLCQAAFDAVEIGPNADLSADNILGSAQVNRVVVGDGCRELGENFLTSPVLTDEEGMWYYPDTPLTLILSGVEKYGDSAFTGRKGLTEIDLTGAAELGERCFEDTGLRQITVPGTVKDIPPFCFQGCGQALVITLEEGVETVGEYAFSECGRIYREKYWWQYLDEETAASFGDLAVPNGSPDYDKFLTIYLPSTLKRVDRMAFSCLYIDGLYMLWCTEPDRLPAFDKEAFSGCDYIHQFYFSQETIEKYGDELDERLDQLEDVGTPAWYYEGVYKPYWSEEELQDD